MAGEGINVWVALLAIYTAGQRFLELGLAEYNRRQALARGAWEFGAKHYPAFFFLHGGWLVAWVTESVTGGKLDSWWYLWFLCFLLAQALKCWAILSLGRYWNTRILVVPGQMAVKKGPYRFCNHPNYLAVVIELFSVPMIFGALVTAVSVGVLNAILLLAVRIPAEEEALLVLKSKF